ncbi:MAG: superoxide dismutase [Nitrosopumilaceae archaeon]|nr:superoxide dismutase [Nitrosopumilaceae archaeon]NIP09913.1 superoxide dismutase [Nitrosopumilaceae archaeon]NIS94684.1 superoxide dismutase [Nitrosopumilaceae archaeon]
MVLYELPKPPYSYDALEPHIDKQTMEIHHLKHHQSYVDGLNNTLEEIGGTSHPKYITSILSDLKSIPESSRNKIQFFGGGYENHRLFWETMNPNGGGTPGGKLEDSIDVYFESFENFKEIFSNYSLGIQGSGWCWLVFNQTFNKIEIITTQNQDSPWSLNKIPLLGLDVWEHAYYLKYQNRRNEYVLSWWNVVNWDYVSNRFSELSH